QPAGGRAGRDRDGRSRPRALDPRRCGRERPGRGDRVRRGPSARRHAARAGGGCRGGAQGRGRSQGRDGAARRRGGASPAPQGAASAARRRGRACPAPRGAAQAHRCGGACPGPRGAASAPQPRSRGSAPAAAGAGRASAPEPLRVRYVRVNYGKDDEALIEKVKGVLTDRGSVTFDDRTNTIIVRDIPRGIDDAQTLVHELDVQSPQVLIEANIVEATRDLARALGVQWGYSFQAGPQTGNPTGLNFPGTVGIGGAGLNQGSAPVGTGGVARPPVPFLFDFPVSNGFGGFGPGSGSAIDLALGSLDGVHALAARLTALEQLGKAKVISRPRVITLNNVAATIQSLTILRVKLPSTGTVINTGTGGAAGSASTAADKLSTGIPRV